MTMAKPIFVLLHGAWHTPQCWATLTKALDRAGYDAVAPQMPSSGSIPPTPGWVQDIQVIRDTVTKLADDNKEIVLVVHSFSGMTGGTALEGLGKQERQKHDLPGGVIRLVYINAFLVGESFQHSKEGTRDNMLEEMKVDFQKGIVTVNPEDAKGLLYQDLSDSVVAELTNDLRPQSLASFWSTTTYASWRYIPTTYILCTKDKPSTVVAARYLVENAKASGEHRIEKLIEIEAGHSPFLSKTDEIAELLIGEAEG